MSRNKLSLIFILALLPTAIYTYSIMTLSDNLLSNGDVFSGWRKHISDRDDIGDDFEFYTHCEENIMLTASLGRAASTLIEYNQAYPILHEDKAFLLHRLGLRAYASAYCSVYRMNTSIISGTTAFIAEGPTFKSRFSQALFAAFGDSEQKAFDALKRNMTTARVKYLLLRCIAQNDSAIEAQIPALLAQLTILRAPPAKEQCPDFRDYYVAAASSYEAENLIHRAAELAPSVDRIAALPLLAEGADKISATHILEDGDYMLPQLYTSITAFQKFSASGSKSDITRASAAAAAILVRVALDFQHRVQAAAKAQSISLDETFWEIPPPS